MILCINYADEKFRPWQQLQTQTALMFGADKVREYSPKDIAPDFYKKNKAILDQPRGAGYWLWKPYIIKNALANVDFGDYVLYADSGAFYIHDMRPLINAMENAQTDVMPFLTPQCYIPLLYEKLWSKRDAFILMDCDDEKYANTIQCMATFILLKKSFYSVSLIDDWLKYAQDPRIITDMPNQLGKENYDGFKENRHDQTIWSLLTKKKGIKPFRDPSQFADISPKYNFPKDVLDRSTFPTIFYLHHRQVGFNRTIEDLLRIYANESQLNEGLRTAKYLLNESMVRESQEVLWRLLQKYQDGHDNIWLNVNTWEDLLCIVFKHKEIGAPYAETFQPLLCRLLLQIMNRRIQLHQLPHLIYAAKCVENKNLIPEEFQNGLAYLVNVYVKQVSNAKGLPKPMATAQELLNAYLELHMPETPFTNLGIIRG